MVHSRRAITVLSRSLFRGGKSCPSHPPRRPPFTPPFLRTNATLSNQIRRFATYRDPTPIPQNQSHRPLRSLELKWHQKGLKRHQTGLQMSPKRTAFGTEKDGQRTGFQALFNN